MKARARAAVLVTGSEILLGRITDMNSGFLARALEAHGVRVERFLAVDDAQESLESGLATLLHGGVDLVVTSGGLGPTHDDRTVAAVAAVTGRPLELSEPTLARIDEIVAEFARARGVDVADFAEGNRKQALVPRGADVLAPIGTAPGVIVAHGEQRIVVLPGPPVELARMWDDAARHPLVAAAAGTRTAAAAGAAALRSAGVGDRRRLRRARRRRGRHGDDDLRDRAARSRS